MPPTATTTGPSLNRFPFQVTGCIPAWAATQELSHPSKAQGGLAATSGKAPEVTVRPGCQ